MANAKGWKDEHGQKARPPAELSLYWMCKNYNALPEQGGILDQDAKVMGLMGTLGAVHNAVKRIQSLKGDQIHNLDDQTAEIWEWLIKLGILS